MVERLPCEGIPACFVWPLSLPCFEQQTTTQEHLERRRYGLLGGPAALLVKVRPGGQQAPVVVAPVLMGYVDKQSRLLTRQ